MGGTFAGQIAGVVTGGDSPVGEVQAQDPGSLFSTGAEWNNGGRLWYGPGLSILRVADPFSLDETGRTVTTFDLRGRANIDLIGHWGLDLNALVGVAWWGDDGMGRLLGWAYRLGAGGSYEIQPGLELLGEVSFWRSDVGSRDGLLADAYSTRQPLAASTWVLSVGARLR